MMTSFIIILLLSLLFLATTSSSSSTSAARTTTMPPPSSPPQTQPFYSYSVIDAMVGAADFNNLADHLILADPSTIPLTLTYFVPNGAASSSDIQDPLVLAYHTVPRRYSFYELCTFSTGFRLPTLLPGNTLLITNSSATNFTINGASITHPDLFRNSLVSVHGVSSVLDPTLFGKLPLESPSSSTSSPPQQPSSSHASLESGGGCLFFVLMPLLLYYVLLGDPTMIMTSFVVILFSLLLTTTTTTAATTVPPPSPPPHHHQFQFHNIIDSIIASGDFSTWHNHPRQTDTTAIRRPVTLTFLIPDDDPFFRASSNLADHQDLAYHIIPRRFSFSQLCSFPTGSRLPTLLPGNTLLITNNSVANFTINDASITHPDLFQNSLLSVHGISSVLDPTLFGRPPLDSPSSYWTPILVPEHPTYWDTSPETADSGHSKNVAITPMSNASSRLSQLRFLLVLSLIVYACCFIWEAEFSAGWFCYRLSDSSFALD